MHKRQFWKGLSVLVLVLLGLGAPVLAAVRTITVSNADVLTLQAANSRVEMRLNGTVIPNGSKLTGHLKATATATPRPSATATRVPPSATPVPSASAPPMTSDCQALHDSFVTTGPDGKRYATWHPPVVNGCAFGHEHGSDPRLFPAFSEVGMPAFDYTSALHGISEPHNGFKVFVVRDDVNGLWYLGVMHQGTGGAARAFVQHHSLDFAVARADGTLLANVHGMADTGAAFARCSRARIPGSGTADFGKSVPVAGCEDTYESWPTLLSIDGFRLEADWDVDNAMTVLKREGSGYSKTEAHFHCPEVKTNPDHDCDRYGDKRELFLNTLSITNGRGAFTDARGVRQYVRPGVTVNVDQRVGFANIRGAQGQIEDGGKAPQIYLSDCPPQATDCTGRNFGWRTVRPPN